MSYDNTLYLERPELKAAIKAAKMTQWAFANRIGMPPPTLSGKLNGTVQMDSSEEKKLLADLAAITEEATA